MDEVRPVPFDSVAVLRQIHALSDAGEIEAALAACDQAVDTWPDIRDVLRLRVRLARGSDDRTRILPALQALLRHDADDEESCAALGELLCENGDFEHAAAVLRPVAMRLGDRGGAMNRFTSALVHIGAWDELRGLRPVLDRLAAEAPAPYAPLGLLAMAELAGTVDRARFGAEAAALQASPRWLQAADALSLVAAAIASARPFSMLRLDVPMAAFAASCGRTAARLLRPEERLALLDTVWPDWFGASSAEAYDLLPALWRDFTDAIEQADIVAMPGAAETETDLSRFGALAEMHRQARFGTDAAFAETGVAGQMHRLVPYLRTALAGLPFLGFVGAHPAMFRKLAHFCGVPDTRFVPVPRAASFAVAEDGVDPRGFLPDGHAAILENLSVPAPGAVFLVSAPGPLGVVYAGRIKALGGIALDIGPLAAQWAGN